VAIAFAYCPSCRIVVAAGADVGAAVHYLDDDTPHPCTVAVNSDEPNLSGAFPGQTADGTTVNDAEAWFAYLKKYIP